MKPVLIAIEGGVAEVRYCPPDVAVVLKDYDVEGVALEAERCRLDSDDDRTPFLLSVEEGPLGEGNLDLKGEAYRLMGVGELRK